MKCDIVILSKSTSLLSAALASVCKHVDKKSVGRIVIGWTGDDQFEEQDTSLLGIDLSVESLSHYNFAQNNNYLVDKHCFSEAVLFMNDDVELVEDSVTKCLKRLEDDQSAGTVGVKLLYRDKTIQHAGQFISVASGKFRGCGHLYWKQPDQELQPAVVAGNTGAFMMVRRDDFLRAGGFNESYKHCFEDVELNLKLMKMKKHNICDCSTWAWHAESQTRKQAKCQEDFARLGKFIESSLVEIGGAAR